LAVTGDREIKIRIHDSLARVYITIGRLFLEVPTADILSSADSVLASVEADIHRVSPILAEAVQRLREATSESLAEVKADCAKLFAGVRKLPAPPWESCYLSGKRQVCTEITESVRLAYLEACLWQESPNVEPEDHIGLELQFLGVMSKRIANALEAGDADLSAAVSAQRAEFIAEHVSRWAGAFSVDLERAAETRFYRCLARLTRDLIDYETRGSAKLSKSQLSAFSRIPEGAGSAAG